MNLDVRRSRRAMAKDGRSELNIVSRRQVLLLRPYAVALFYAVRAFRWLSDFVFSVPSMLEIQIVALGCDTPG
jgi:hypothetical protein